MISDPTFQEALQLEAIENHRNITGCASCKDGLFRAFGVVLCRHGNRANIEGKKHNYCKYWRMWGGGGDAKL